MSSHHSTDFDAAFWQDHWQARADGVHDMPPHPYIEQETAQLPVGTALDAGCGTGAEARWLAEHGWQVTGIDLSERVLEIARQRHGTEQPSIQWLRGDLTTWEPTSQWDLVVTSYAHTSIPQLELYTRLARWVTPGGTLLIIAHDHPEASGEQHPVEATAQETAIVELFSQPDWQIVTARRATRPFHGQILHDVIVRARRVQEHTEG